MEKNSLVNTNKYLCDPKQREEMIVCFEFKQKLFL